jgi:hypothetical protein
MFQTFCYYGCHFVYFGFREKKKKPIITSQIILRRISNKQNMNKLKRLFTSNKPKDAGASTGNTINGLRDMEEMLTKKQMYIEQKIKEQVILAKKYGMKNKHGLLYSPYSYKT